MFKSKVKQSLSQSPDDPRL